MKKASAYIDSMAPAEVLTADELVALNLKNKRTELVRGRLVVASDPDTVRAPDVAFIRAARVPDPLPVGYADVAPDLAVEILSPNDRAGEVLAKVSDWLSAGCTLVWVVDPDRRMARIYRADGSEAIVAIDSSLDGEDVLPGFTLPLTDLLL